ncbi:hypothetical protein CF327_g7647, partial [Tilletia walkeri]
MSDNNNNNNNVPVPLELAASLRILERLPARERPGVEAAIRAQYEADQEEAQAQAARAAEEEEERFQAEEAAAEQEAQRQLAAMREQEAHLAAAKNLVDLVKTQDGGPEAKDKGKKVQQNDDLENTLDLLVAIPSQKIRDKIRACDYIDLWHLTAEGMAAATRSKLSGDTTFELGSDGSFKLKDSVTGFKADQDLAMATWVTALGHYVRIMQAEGVVDSIVQSMLRLNHIMTTHPDFDRHATAIRLWHQHQRRQWVISASLNSDGQRFNLGKPNPQHFEELRLRLLEERAERRILGLPGGASGHGGSSSSGSGWGGGGSGGGSGGSGGKRPPPNDPPSPGPRAKAARTSFRLASTGRSNSSFAGQVVASSLRIPSSPSASTINSKVAQPSVGPTALTVAPTVALADTAPPLANDSLTSSTITSWDRPFVLLADAFEAELRHFGLLDRHSSLLSGLRSGFHIGIPALTNTLIQNNHNSARSHPDIISTTIQRELTAGRYRGPFSSEQLQSIIGPFQNSPLGLVPKGVQQWRLIQDFSWPRAGNSINSHLSSDSWPTTWGASRDVVRTLLALPVTAQAAVRDVADAFRILVLHSSQWPGTVVRGEDGLFYVDMCLGFGLAPATGVWGAVADALADICRAHGLGLILKWVDDFIFFTVPLSALDTVNASRAQLATTITGPQSRGGVSFFADADNMEHVEDYQFSLRNHVAAASDELVSSLAAITAITAPLGVPWKRE